MESGNGRQWGVQHNRCYYCVDVLNKKIERRVLDGKEIEKNVRHRNSRSPEEKNDQLKVNHFALVSCDSVVSQLIKPTR